MQNYSDVQDLIEINVSIPSSWSAAGLLCCGCEEGRKCRIPGLTEEQERLHAWYVQFTLIIFYCIYKHKIVQHY